MAIPFVVDPFLVRGLDYYDNVVFEFTSELGAVIVLVEKDGSEVGRRVLQLAGEEYWSQSIDSLYWVCCGNRKVFGVV